MCFNFEAHQKRDTGAERAQQSSLGVPGAPELGQSWQEVEKRYPDGVPCMDPLDDLGVDEPEALAAVRRMEALEAQLATNAAFLVRKLHLQCHAWARLAVSSAARRLL